MTLVRRSTTSIFYIVPVCLWLSSCASFVPSARRGSIVDLPIPASIDQKLSADRLDTTIDGKNYLLSARTLISTAFENQPNIASTYALFKSEEARYDFFYTSRDSLTPRLTISNAYNETRSKDDVNRNRDHSIKFGIEKQFFDTTRLDVAVGYDSNATNEAIGNQPFLSGNIRYPLAVSREKLERTSEDIFRRNALDDAQLAYIQEIRRRLERTLFRFYEVINLTRNVDDYTSWKSELEALQSVVDSTKEHDAETDRSRLSAELTRVSALLRNVAGRLEIQIARLKDSIGLPFHAKLELVDEPFNPFEGLSHDELLRASIDTDPEIATLRNSKRNAEVQLDLAQRGTWDLALQLGGQSRLEGRGENDGLSDWSVTIGFDVSAVDSRVTNSLTRQAQANINRFERAIAARENQIFVDTLEPLVRIETLSQSRTELKGNLPRFKDDYKKGIEQYKTGTLNIDNLLIRRETLFTQQNEIARLKFLVGANVAQLSAATGKFFELLSDNTNEDG